MQPELSPQQPEDLEQESFANLARYRRALQLIVDEHTVVFSGVELERKFAGAHVPNLERFEKNVLTANDLRLMQRIAVTLDLNQPVLIESGSGLGKTETVEHMCALLGWDCHYANCHDFEPDILIGSKTTREDTKSGFGWKDGIVLQAIRNGGVLYLDEYNFMRGETRGRLHEVLDAVLRGKQEVVVIENDGERVPVHPDLRIVCSQNPPGGKFSDREVLDPAQFTRFVYLKEPSEMPRSLKRARALGAVGIEPEQDFSLRDLIEQNRNPAINSPGSMPDIQDVVEQYLEFEHGIGKLVERGNLAAEQQQPVYFAFQRDYKRVLQYMQRYHTGDTYETMQAALRFYYQNRFESQADRDKVEELIACIQPKNDAPPERRNLEQRPPDQDEDDLRAAA